MSYRVPPPALKKWQPVARERVGSFRIFHVEKTAMKDGEGKPRGDFFTLACPDWCNVVAVTEADEIVLVWQYRFGTDALSLEIPGGVIDEGEAPIESARRELLEETGYASDLPLEPLLVVEPNPANQGNRCYTFLVRGARNVAATSFDEHEELEVALVPRAKLGELLDSGQVTHALVHSALAELARRGM
jgi:8-oxo-dGTP pyrophosphatase MutT (NUDIX family)